MKQEDQRDLILAILEAVRPPGRDFSQHEIARITGIPRPTIRNIERRCIKKLRASLSGFNFAGHSPITCSLPANKAGRP